MRKHLLTTTYLVGWAYPLCVIAYIIMDKLFKIRTSLMGPFDFGNDSIIGYVYISLIIAVVTFAAFFILTKVCFKTAKSFYLSLINLPLYFLCLFSNFLLVSVSHYGKVIYLCSAGSILLMSMAIIAFSVYSLYSSPAKSPRK